MHTQVYICSEQCPVGCGEVIFLQGISNGVIFCFCTGCELAWDNPEKTQFESGLNELVSAKDFSPEGVIFPNLEAIAKAGFNSQVIRSIASKDFAYTEEEINEMLQ